MKTNAKKRMLISSVAMLLVAMIALGTATFAWFTQNTTATTENLEVSTVKSSELKISKNDLEWTDKVDYGFSKKVLKPASTANGIAWFTASATKKDGPAANKSTVDAITSSVLSDTTYQSNGYVFFNQLNVTNTGKADVEKVKISFTLKETQQTAGKKYLRVAVVPAAEGGKNKAMAIPEGKTFADYVYSVGADSAEGITGITGTGDTKDFTTASLASLDASAGVEIDVGTLVGTDATTGTQTKYYNVYVWFEGQDADCYDTYAGNAMPELTFTVSGSTVEQNK